MSESHFSANADSFEAATTAITAGFEVAVADYETSWMAFQSSKNLLQQAHDFVDFTSARLEEANISLDEIATDFNATATTDPDYGLLMELLDISHTHMLEANDDYNTANANLIFADEQYHVHKANIDEALAIARELRSELDYTVQIEEDYSAANDDYYESAGVIDLLSDSARHFYQFAA